MGRCIPAKLEKVMDAQTRLHRFRYHLARGFVGRDDLVLDIGSGSGYGTGILSEAARYVIGIEKEKSEVDGATKYYKKDNNEFVCADLEEMFVPKCEVAVAFEVIEHLYKPEVFIKKLKEKTKKFIIFSVPIGEELIWIEETKEFQAVHDSTHHASFPTDESVLKLFLDDQWADFFRFRLGVTLISVLYNKEAI